MTDPELHGRVPTCTACYIELSDRLVELPGGHPGRLVRFMNDQQCCLIWYVHLAPGGGHTVVSASPAFDGRDGKRLEDVSSPRDLAVCAPSFEDFIHRFWLENTLWFALQSGRALDAEEQAYVDAVKKARASM